MSDNKKLKELISNYKTCFNTDTGKMVLEDLKKDPTSIIQRTLKAIVTKALFTKVKDL